MNALPPDSAIFLSIGTALTAVVKLFILAVDVAFFIHLVLRLIKRDRPLIYEELSRTRNVISWPKRHEVAASETLGNTVINE